MPTWTDAQILRWAKEAELDLVMRNFMVWDRFSIAVSSGVATYDIDPRLYGITDVLYKGQPLVSLLGLEPHALNKSFRTETGNPKWYSVSNDGLAKIRLVPVPSEDIPKFATGFFSTNIENAFLVSGFMLPNPDLDYFQIPDYLTRRYLKAYVLYKAFLTEGIGQNLQASQYWQKRYEFYRFQIERIKKTFYKTKEQLDILPPASIPLRKIKQQLADNPIPKPVFELLQRVTSNLNNWTDEITVSLT